MSYTTIVVPCYNESQRLDACQFRRCVERCDWLRFCMVNDGSRDNTRDLLAALCQSDPARFDFCDLAVNQGKAEAVRRGVLQALLSRPGYVGYWDADLATPLQDIARFREVLQQRPEIELVLGSRIQLLGHRVCRRPLRRRLGRVFARAASLALSVPIYDTQCGAKLLRVTPAMEAAFADPFCSRWIFDVEILARLTLGRRAAGSAPLAEAIYELPLDEWNEVAGSKVKAADFVTAARELAMIYWRYLRPGIRRSQTALRPAGEAPELTGNQRRGERRAA